MAARRLALFALIGVGCFSNPSAEPGGPCGGNDFCPDGLVCLGGTCEAITSGDNVVFVTSTPFAASDIGGLSGADQKCNAAAATVGLTGIFRAYLSDANNDAIERIRETTARGWSRVDGLPFADTVEDLEAGVVFYPALLDEQGAPFFSEVWTGSGRDGLRSMHCDSWTSDSDQLGADVSTTTQTVAFGGGTAGSCADERHLLCFGVDRQGEVEPEPAQGPVVFLSQPFVPGASIGLGGADAQCQSEARDNGLDSGGEVFLAYLATAAVRASARATNAGDVWVRPDGIAVGANLEINRLDTSISVTADGSYVDALVWTGTDSPLVASGTQRSCSNWENPTEGVSGFAATSGDALWFAGGERGCNETQARVYCVEQVPYNRAFVSSTTFAATALDAAQADSECDQLGDGAFGAGSYVAYLSDASSNAIDRLRDSGARGWVRPDGRPFADTVDALHAGEVFYPTALNERGSPTISQVWTGTDAAGNVAANCADWSDTGATASTGHSTRTVDFGSFELAACNVNRRILCLQVDHDRPVTPPPAPGRLAFLGSEFVPSATRDLADLACQTDAADAGLGGAFAAVLAGPGTAAARFMSPGEVWVRPDGIQLVDEVDQVGDVRLSTSISVDAMGRYVVPDAAVWTGGTSPTVGVGGTEESCEDWGSDAANGLVGSSSDSRWFRPTGASPLPCDTPGVRLYCLEQ